MLCRTHEETTGPEQDDGLGAGRGRPTRTAGFDPNFELT